ncbi:hypothetical protein KJ980_06890 [Patescibacteria group bacterium]|nr:hypothetical protein [Patescibacteria group bacterium]
MILKFIYTLFIGILLALFVGFGIAAFYEEPKYPEPPISLRYSSPVYPETKESTAASRLKADQIKQDKLEKDFQKKISVYNRNVSVIALTAAIIYLIVSLTLTKHLMLLSDGLLLGGVFTLLYGIGRGFGSNDSKFQFIMVTIGLVISLVLGYIKFIKPKPER